MSCYSHIDSIKELKACKLKLTYETKWGLSSYKLNKATFDARTKIKLKITHFLYGFNLTLICV